MKRSFVLDMAIVVLIVILIVTLSASCIGTLLGRCIGLYTSSNVSKVIMIDAGHGGVDGGAVGTTGTIEKHINLAISQKLKGFLESEGYTVIMTRETDEGLYYEQGSIRDKKNVDLKMRKQMIKEHSVDLFISIHLNKFQEEKYHGAQVFFLAEDEQSKLLAAAVQRELVRILNNENKRVEKPSGTYYLFKGNTIPSIIVECGFLSNHDEERLLSNDEYQNKLAWCIYSGITKYFNDPK